LKEEDEEDKEEDKEEEVVEQNISLSSLSLSLSLSLLTLHLSLSRFSLDDTKNNTTETKELITCFLFLFSLFLVSSKQQTFYLGY